MKILAIRIKNLASLEGDYEIDFQKEPLASAGIFAITGPTGSGKSTILDAICLALFAKTPRHNNKEKGIDINDVGGKIKLGDTRGILRKGEHEGRAEVDFAGADGNHYNATWMVRRARGKADGAMQAENVELTNLTNKAKYPGKKTETLAEIERLAGLNFEQFTRSVLLAQGDFTAFLKAEKSEKSSLLEKLTGTDVYSAISVGIFNKNKEAAATIRNLQSQIEGVELLSAEALTAAEEQIIQLSEQLTLLQTAQTNLTAGINWHKTLDELEANRQMAEAALQEAIDRKTAAADGIAYFGLVERVQEVRPLTDKKNTIQKALANNRQELAVLSATIADQAIKHTATTTELQNAEAQLKQSIHDFEEAQPLIDRAKTLDTLLKEKRTQSGQAEQAVEQAASDARHQQQAIERKEAEQTQVARQINDLKEWKNKHAGNEPVAEHIKLIRSKLADAGMALARQKSTERKIADTLAKATGNEKQIAALEQQVKDKDAVIKQKTLEADQKKTELAVYDIAALKAQETATAEQSEHMAEAMRCWEQLYTRQRELDSLKEKLAACITEASLRNSELLQNNTALHDAALLKDHSQKLLDRARLEAAKDVEQLRNNLTHCDPCPVCGSNHHPYADGHSKKLNEVLDGLQQEYNRCNQTYNTLLTQNGSLQKLCETLGNNKTVLEQETTHKSKEVTELSTKWNDCGLEPDVANLPVDQRSQWLAGKATALRTTHNNIKTQIQAYERINNALQLQKDEITALTADFVSMQQVYRNCQHDSRTYEQDELRLRDEQATTQQQIGAIVNELNPYFVKPDWHENWQAEPEAFEQKLTNFATEWNKKTVALDAATKKLEELALEADYMNRQMTQLEDTKQKANAAFATCSKELITLTDERKALFGGVAIHSVEQQYKAGIEKWKQQAAHWKTQQELIDAELNKLNGSAEQLTRLIADNEMVLQSTVTDIMVWLQELNNTLINPIDEESLYKLLAYNNTWIAAERNRIAAIDDAIKTTEATCNERTLQADNHRARSATHESREELEQLLAATNEKTDAAVREKNEQHFKVRRHYENKVQIGGIEAQIAQQRGVCENWQKLDELVGSATGEKFRQIAQEYTLDVLLGFANMQIRALASRYKLERIPNSLALQVIDTDMGNEIRSVHSLSGGESFLVSLALALGLASLSSNRMKVESLFIDEGFGTLDEETLVVAMEALDRLQNQGRKVGVITHVREMTERISTKIKVTKLAGGKSRVDVVG